MEEQRNRAKEAALKKHAERTSKQAREGAKTAPTNATGNNKLKRVEAEPEKQSPPQTKPNVWSARSKQQEEERLRNEEKDFKRRKEDEERRNMLYSEKNPSGVKDSRQKN